MQQEAAIRIGNIYALILSALVAGPVFAQTSKPSAKYDWSTPLAASASLARAGEQHEQFATAYQAATDDERALLRALVEQDAASAELEKACVDRFKRGLPNSKLEPIREEVEVNGDEAFVYPGGKESGLRIRWVRVNGEWKVPMADILRVHLMSYKTLQNAIDQKQSWTKQLRQVTDEVRAGRYASPDEVDKKLGDLAEADDTASTQPTKQ
jgi:hypothetical protein